MARHGCVQAIGIDGLDIVNASSQLADDLLKTARLVDTLPQPSIRAGKRQPIETYKPALRVCQQIYS